MILLSRIFTYFLIFKTIIDPRSPEEDNKSKYQWRRIKSSVLAHPPAHQGWSCSSTVVIAEGHCSYSYHNYRRKWDWNCSTVIDDLILEDSDSLFDETTDDEADPLEETVTNSTQLPNWNP